MKTVTITDQILSGNLSNAWTGDEYDEWASAQTLAELLEEKYRERAESEYPGSKIIINIDVQRSCGASRELVIVVEDGDGVDFPDTAWYENEFEDLEFDDWATS